MANYNITNLLYWVNTNDLFTKANEALKTTFEYINRFSDEISHTITIAEEYLLSYKSNKANGTKNKITPAKASIIQNGITGIREYTNKRTNRIDSSKLAALATKEFKEMVRENVIETFTMEYGRKCNIDTICNSIMCQVDPQLLPRFSYDLGMVLRAIAPDIQENKKAFNQNYTNDNFITDYLNTLRIGNADDFYAFLDRSDNMVDNHTNPGWYFNNSLLQEINSQDNSTRKEHKTPLELMKQVETNSIQEYLNYYTEVLKPQLSSTVSSLLSL